jgi:putative oxidoreductase
MNALCEWIQRYGPVIGRSMIALIFLKSAIGKITAFTATAAMMAGKGMPMTEVLLVGAITIELVAGTMLVLGWKTHWAALGLLVFLVPATAYFHDYWNAAPAQVMNQTNHFFKNFTIMGALVFIMGMGAGPLSVDRRKAVVRDSVRDA